MAKSLTLRNIPPDVFLILLKEQHEAKANRNIGRFGIEQTIYKVLREFERCKKEKPEKK
jgi:hypothetical protein